MSKFKEQSKELQLKYFVGRKLNGLNFREIADLMDKHNVDDDDRKFIMEKLAVVDRHQKKQDRNDEKVVLKKRGLTNLLIGISILIIGFIFYVSTSATSFVFLLNFLIWGFAGVMLVKGIKSLIDSSDKY